MSDQDKQRTQQHIQVVQIQLEMLATLDAVKAFLELKEKQELLYRSLPKEDEDAGDAEPIS